MSRKKEIVGIDLGTTNTCIYYKTNKGYEVAEAFGGKRTMPSVVFFPEDGGEKGNVVVGNVAKEQIWMSPERVIYGAKRLIGHRKGDEDVETLFKNAGFKIEYDKNDFPVIKIPGKDRKYKPEEISSLILNEANNSIKKKTGHNIDECVITVPAYFNDLQRRSTLLAAELAGINCIKLVNEPTAAAIAFQDKIKFDNGNVLVFDFGGGTLDVSILNVEKNKFTVMAVSGNTSLGGEDIDSLIVEEMIKRFKRKNPGSNPEKNPKSMALLRKSCEEAKCCLSNSIEASIFVGCFANGKDLDEKLTRECFEYICNDIIDQLTDPIDIALAEAELDIDEINHIILVGGSSAIPFVSKRVSEYLGKQPLKASDPNESVACGAAIVCDKISNNEISFGENSCVDRITIQEHNAQDGLINIIETQPISIGIKHTKGKFQKFIHRNKKLPQEGEFTFTTIKDNQTSADIQIYQGDDDNVDMKRKSHILLGKYTVSDLPPKKIGEIKIKIKLKVDEGGILLLEACCNEDGITPISKKIETKEVLDDDEKKAIFDEIKEVNTRNDLIDQYNNFLNNLSKAIFDAQSRGKNVRSYENYYNSIKDDKLLCNEAIINIIQEIEEKINKIKAL